MRASHFIKLLDNEDLDLVKKKFERIRGIPQVCSAIDCTYVEVKLWRHTRSMDYFDKNKDQNYVVQTIINTELWFWMSLLDFVVLGMIFRFKNFEILSIGGIWQLLESRLSVHLSIRHVHHIRKSI
jgi:hypothetical protein